ncbi:hypothetical protein EV363DRAFT_1403138 [Boletus edulis]|nr:hypothetical protein EV363DRAFT_1403138 [Boletus edulis]
MSLSLTRPSASLFLVNRFRGFNLVLSPFPFPFPFLDRLIPTAGATAYLVLLTRGPTVGPFVTEYSLSSSLSMCYPLEPSSNSGTCCASFFLRQAKPLPMPNYGRN